MTQEAKYYKKLRDIELSHELSMDLLKQTNTYVQSEGVSKSVLQSANLVLNPEVVLWLNDLEKDKKYARWSRNIYDTLQMGFNTQLKFIAKNLYNIVLFLDISNNNTWTYFDQIYELYKKNIPVRFGLMLFDSKNQN